ncbi:GNAT family N-acetyltransferase [Salinarimonas soli]|uniref:GNAT family N-acetyltransferase n=1 Tax=Salinarimonas soli TaxID=1638099 RepID=UPI001661DDE5|nr:GNAT family N-acetyltransferase [Salinarimonas soli]
MSPAIRLCREDDAAAWLALRLRSLREHPESFHSTFEEWEHTTPAQAAERLRVNRMVGAFAGDGTLVGAVTLALQARPGAKRRHKVEIWNVYVAPEARGTGTARALMERAVAEARALGFEAVVLSVSAHAERARALYESLGFVTYGIEPRGMRLPDGRTFDDRLMQLDLRPA